MRAFVALLGAIAWPLATATSPGHCQQRYSTRMIDSIISRGQGIQDSGTASNTLENGILGQAMEYAIARYPSTRSKYAAYLSGVLGTASSAGLTNVTFAATRPLDRFSLATAIESATESNIVPLTTLLQDANNAINASLALQKRNPEGGFWYYVYPEWSYLDGMVSVLPFMAAQPDVNYTDMNLQLTLLRDHCTDPGTSLLVHGYDWSRTAVWANKVTGASPYVWGRSLGWFLTGMVETWERASCALVQAGESLQLCGTIQNMTFQIASSLVQYADPGTGAWWQLVTFPGRQGNYLESSSTALFIYSLLKALRIGLIYGAGPDYKQAALKAYDYTLGHFVTDTGNGTIGYDKTVSVCSLNSTASYEYYTTQPILPNSLLGEAAFVLASLEVERLWEC